MDTSDGLGLAVSNNLRRYIGWALVVPSSVLEFWLVELVSPAWGWSTSRRGPSPGGCRPFRWSAWPETRPRSPHPPSPMNRGERREKGTIIFKGCYLEVGLFRDCFKNLPGRCTRCPAQSPRTQWSWDSWSRSRLRPSSSTPPKRRRLSCPARCRKWERRGRRWREWWWDGDPRPAWTQRCAGALRRGDRPQPEGEGSKGGPEKKDL